MNRPSRHRKNDVIFKTVAVTSRFLKLFSDITMMTLSTQKQFFKTLVNTNSHAKFGVSMTFGFEKHMGHFASCVKCVG